MHRPALVLGTAAALLTLAACGTNQATGSPAGSGGSGASTTARALDGTQPYGAVVDLYADLTGGTLQCTHLTPQVGVPLVRSQATCTTPSGSVLALQTWADATARDAGVAQLAQQAAAARQPFCTVVGRGAQAAWSVAAGGDGAGCDTAATTLGGRTVTG